jgi:hypothetical protein
MVNVTTDDHVLPRPVERLPEYAHAKARQTLAEKIVVAFALSDAAANAIADAVVNPSEVRKTIGETQDPDVERIPVPGGTLLGIRTTVWARRTMPDPRNPRTLPSRRHPFAVEPGTGGEDSKFRPLPEPRAYDSAKPQQAELSVDIENRHHLIWASQQARDFVIAENDWRRSIESQGVMEAVWLVATTYQHADGTPPVTALVSVEGSSRETAVHDILGIHTADVPYDDADAKLRAHIRRLNDAYDRGEGGTETAVALRCERIPALILLGFKPHMEGSTGFPTAVKSLVALRHVDPPKPWGEGPENEALADEVLDELYRRDLISETQRGYYAGSCTRAEARAARLPDDPVLRAAEIVRLFSGKNDRVQEAIRVAVTSQSTRKRITPKLVNDLATALILRAVADDRGKVDQIRRYLRHAFGKSVHRAEWNATGKPTEQLVDQAMAEVREAIGSGVIDEPGPASLELAVRSAYPLVVSGRLNADRGTSGNDQPDRRTPGEVLDAMRRSPQGIMQLGQVLRDFEQSQHLKAVDETGAVKRLPDNSGDLLLNDVYLRNEFPPPGKAKSAGVGDTAVDRYERAVHALGIAIHEVDNASRAVAKVLGDDGLPIVDARGVEQRLTEAWADILRQVSEEIVIWKMAYKKKHGVQPSVSALNDEEEGESTEDDVYEGRDHEDAEEAFARNET